VSVKDRGVKWVQAVHGSRGVVVVVKMGGERGRGEGDPCRIW
jgi:hypothetical protein